MENNPNFDDDQELYEHFRFQVDHGQGPLRVDKFLMHRIEHVSRNRIQAAADAGMILANGQAVKSSYKVKPHDVITVMMPEPHREITLVPQDIPLEIVYEDDQVILINKPAGMVVHPAYGNYSGTLVNALMHHFRKEMAKDTGLAPFLVHRIDKDTSGLLLVAKYEQAQTKLQKQFYFHTIKREYEALVWGDVAEDSGVIEGNIARSKTNRKVFRVYDEEEIGKHAVTRYQVLERFGYVTRIQCELETGRTHQIRVHMKHLGHTLFNDETYGGDKILRGTTFSKYQQFVQNCFKLCPRQALHARSLGFEHPKTREHLYFTQELPEDMGQLIEKWKTYAVHKALGEE
jgi:23S rRNA pseudouridine1911/1915/1917 synthase